MEAVAMVEMATGKKVFLEALALSSEAQSMSSSLAPSISLLLHYCLSKPF